MITIGFGAAKPTVSISGVTITGGLNDSSRFRRRRRRQGRPRTRQLDRSGRDDQRQRHRRERGGAEVDLLFAGAVRLRPLRRVRIRGGRWDRQLRQPDRDAHADQRQQAGGGVTMYGFGGGIANHSQGKLTLRRSVVTGNRAVVTVPNGRFTDGGGITDGGVLTIEDSVVSDNSSEVTSSVASTFPFDEQLANAGGIYITGSATISDTTIGGNSARSSNLVGDAHAAAGGIDSDGSLVLGRSRLVDNEVARASRRPPQAPQSRPSAESRARASRLSVTARSAATAPPPSAPQETVIAAGGGLGNTGQTTLQRTQVIGNSGTANGAAAPGGRRRNPQRQLRRPRRANGCRQCRDRQHAQRQPGDHTAGWRDLHPKPAFTLTQTVVAGNQPDQCFGC